MSVLIQDLEPTNFIIPSDKELASALCVEEVTVQKRREKVAQVFEASGLAGPWKRERIASWALRYRDELLGKEDDENPYGLPETVRHIDPRLSCPPTRNLKDVGIDQNLQLDFDRGRKIMNGLRQWATSDEMRVLLQEWRIQADAQPDAPTFFRSLANATEDWNFRRDLEERWRQDRKTRVHIQELVIGSAQGLGMREATLPKLSCYDMGIVLGGARLAPKCRTLYLAKTASDNGVEFGSVAFASSLRPIDEANERPYTLYASSEAKHEFDLMHSAASLAPNLFGDPMDHQDVKSSTTTWDPERLAKWASCSLVRRYRVSRGGLKAYGIGAPSLSPTHHRPRTPDTLRFLNEQIGLDCGLKRGSQILLVTSMIYVPYQQIEAMRVLALPLGVYVETIGFPRMWNAPKGSSRPIPNLHEVGNYLQEIRSALQACGRLEEDLEESREHWTKASP